MLLYMSADPSDLCVLASFTQTGDEPYVRRSAPCLQLRNLDNVACSNSLVFASKAVDLECMIGPAHVQAVE